MPTVKFIAASQAFSITVNGLVPFTQHFVYFERQLVPAAQLAPKGGVPGQALTTDLNGKLEFTYYYSTGLPAETSSIEAAQQMANAVAGIKELVVLSINAASITDANIRSAISYARTYIKVDVLQPEEVTIQQNVIQQAQPTWDGSELNIGGF